MVVGEFRFERLEVGGGGKVTRMIEIFLQRGEVEIRMYGELGVGWDLGGY